ncbi:hypothetical protein [Microcystis phage Mwe-JY05]
MSSNANDQRPAEPVDLAVNPDTGIVHRRMSDGTWYALDAIPGRDAVADENLLLYFPQQVTTYCPCITKSCQHPPGRCSSRPDTTIETHSWLLGGWQRWMFCRRCADVAVARWPGEARIVGAAPTGRPTVERVAKATAWFAVAALLLVAAIEAARGGSR